VGIFAKLFGISAKGLAVAGVTPVGVLFVLIMFQTIPRLMDPCVIWGFDGHAQKFERPCPGGKSGIPQGKLTYISLAVGMPTAMLLLGVLGLVGAYRSERRVVFAVGLIFSILTVPMMVGNFGMVTLISAFCFIVSSFLI
jgi:hypothetical protein